MYLLLASVVDYCYNDPVLPRALRLLVGFIVFPRMFFRVIAVLMFRIFLFSPSPVPLFWLPLVFTGDWLANRESSVDFMPSWIECFDH